VIALLQELARYAERQRLSGLPGYKTKRIRWVVVLGETGEYVDVIEMERGQDERVCPHLEQSELVSGKTARSHFLLDTAAVVTGYGSEEGDTKRKEKRECFIQLLHEAAAECPDLSLCALALEHPAVMAKANAILEARKAKPTDNITFRVGSRLVTEMTGWQPWWRRYQSSLHQADPETMPMVCLISGDVVIPVSTHAKVSGLSRVGGQPSGSNLISFDKEAFTSYGLAQSANAACSEVAVAMYRSALDHLVAAAAPPLGGALMLHWYDQPIPVEDDVFSDIVSFGDESDAANALVKARELLTAVHKGTRPDLTDNRYFVLQVSGSGGRVMVRDWFADNFARLVESVNAWYDALEIVKPRGGEIAEPPRLRGLLTRLVSYRPSEKYQDTSARIDRQLAPLLPRLWHTVLEGAPMPDSAAQGALAYVRSRLLREDDEGSTGNLDRVACAVLKAWLARKADRKSDKETAMEARLNKEHPAPAYQSGRLMAVLAALQTSALGDVGAGVVQRYYAAASTTPSLVLGRLVRNAQYHLQKIESKGLALWYDRQIAEIISRLGDKAPAVLDLEGQTLFALGYYQQKAEMYGDRKGENTTIHAAGEGGN
jgi:CRISPR-associated protein Csd1